MITIAAFNIQTFGKTKRSKPEVMAVLAEIAREFDVLLVQEIRDSTQTTAGVFLDEINRGPGAQYDVVEGRRVGRTSSKEQYAIYYRKGSVALLGDPWTVNDPRDVFEREPLVASFRAGNFDFTIVGCHVKPSEAEAELRALQIAVDAIVAANPAEQDVILLGDLNADGSYLDERELGEIFPTDLFEVVISDEADTMTTSDNTYDRIVLRHSTARGEYVPGSAHVFEFDREYAIEDEAFIRSVSDHYPVFAEFRTAGPDDDGPSLALRERGPPSRLRRSP